ncbi:MAG: type II secretion system protein GspN [Desulfuromonadales bacterium]
MKIASRFRSAGSSSARGQSAKRGRRAGFVLACLVLFLVSALAGFYLFFPGNTLKERIVHEAASRADLTVMMDSLSLSPILTLKATGLAIRHEDLPVPVGIDQLTLAPEWTTLLSGDPGISIDASIMGGTISSVVTRSGAVTAQGADVRLDLPLQEPFPLRVGGQLSRLDFSGGTRLDTDTASELSVRLTDVEVLGLEGLNAEGTSLSLGEITLNVEGLGRAMKVNTLTAQDGAFDVSGSGTVLIGRTASSSRLNLSLQVKPTAKADPSLVSLLELSGQPGDDGAYTLRLSGTPTRPVLQ